MNDLKVITMNGNDVIDSREIATMVKMEHKYLLRKLEGAKNRKGYIEIMENSNINPAEYFIPHTYKDISGKENKCYLFTKKGCEFILLRSNNYISNAFTAKYIDSYNNVCKMKKFDTFKTINDLIIKKDKMDLKMYRKNKEKDYEKHIVDNFNKIFPNYTLIKNQYRIKGIGVIDILAKENETNRDVIIELKIHDCNPNFQLLSYATNFNDPILIGITELDLDDKKMDSITYFTYKELNIEI